MDPSDRYFTFNRKMLSLAGLWHTQTYKERILRYYILGSMSLYSVFGELCQLLTLNLDLRAIVRSLQVFLPAIGTTSIYYTGILHFMTLQKIYNYIQHDWQRLKDDTELKIMQKHTYFTKLFTMLFGLMGYSYIILSISPSLLRIILSTNEVRSDIDHYPIISCIDYFLNQETYYYPILTYQIVTTLILAMVSLSSFSIYFSFIQHACASLSIIKYQIYCPFINNDQNDDVSTTPIDISHWMIDIVQRLVRITKFMNLVNSTYEKNYLFLMFLAFIVLIMNFLCLSEIPVLLEHKENRRDVLELIIFIVATLLLIYINCYVGQTLVDNSIDVYREACSVPIYKISVKIQKLLLTTLMVSAKPCAISIGKVFVASHEFFSRILQSTLSFAMILHSLQTT